MPATASAAFIRTQKGFNAVIITSPFVLTRHQRVQIVIQEPLSTRPRNSLRIPKRVRRPSAAREALGFSPLVQAGWTDASRIECVPFVAADAEPFVFLPWRPAAKRAADAEAGCGPVSLHVGVGRNGGSISRWSHLFGSLNSVFIGKAAPIPPNH